MDEHLAAARWFRRRFHIVVSLSSEAARAAGRKASTDPSHQDAVTSWIDCLAVGIS